MKWVVFFFVPIFFHEAKLIKLPHVYSLNFFFLLSKKKTKRITEDKTEKKNMKNDLFINRICGYRYINKKKNYRKKSCVLCF